MYTFNLFVYSQSKLKQKKKTFEKQIRTSKQLLEFFKVSGKNRKRICILLVYICSMQLFDFCIFNLNIT